MIDYVWFNGEPLAQVETTTGAIHYYFNDHLGAPLLTTNSTGTVDWRVEREPFGEIFAVRAGGDRHQPLGLPGQEYDPSSPERQYNVFRWIRNSWGRYTQSDPELWVWSVHPDPFRYVDSNPVRFVDRIGLYTVMPNCNQAPFNGQIQAGIADSCKRTTTPGTRCHNALRNISAALGDPNANRLPNCFKKACNEPGPNIACAPCMDEPCAQITGGLGTSSITIGRGAGPGCPAGRGLGYGGTIFHETLHHCAFGNIFGGDEPDDVGPRASWFRYAEKACFNWRDPSAPPLGPPQPRN